MFRVNVIFASVLFLVSTESFGDSIQIEDAKQIARVYVAALDRLPEEGGLNYWIQTHEDGMSLLNIARKFYESSEFTAKYGDLTNREYVEQLYRNVLGREGESSGIIYWLNHLEMGVSRAEILLSFSESIENLTNTDEIFLGLRVHCGRWIFELDPEPCLNADLQILLYDFRFSWLYCKQQGTIHYGVGIENLGPADAKDIVVSLKEELFKTQGWVTNYGECTSLPGEISCRLSGDILAGDVAWFDFYSDYFQNKTNRIHQVKFGVSSSVEDPNLSNNSQTVRRSIGRVANNNGLCYRYE